MLEEEMTAGKLKEMLMTWFAEKENKQTLKTFIRSLILNKLTKEEEQSNFKHQKLILDNIDIALVYFVCDYLIQNHFHYSLSVFSSEISCTKLNEYVYDYFNKISYKWNTNKPPMLEYYAVHNVLLTLNIDPASSVGNEIINRYYMLGEGSLLKVVASAMKSFNGTDARFLSNLQYSHGNPSENALQLQTIGPHNDKSTNIPSESHQCAKDTCPCEMFKTFLHKKDLQINRRISSQKQEFSRCKKILVSCYNALITKLDEVYQLMGHIHTQKKEIVHKLEVIESLNDNLKLPVKQNLQTKAVKLVDKSVMVMEARNLQDNFTQTQIPSFVDNSTETCIKKSINVGLQTESITNPSDLVQWQLEKLELLQFIDQQQERIKGLTEKTMELTTKIISQQCSLPGRNETVNKSHLCSFNDCQASLEEIIYKFDQNINKFYFNFESMKKKSHEAEKCYSNYLDTLLNS